MGFADREEEKTQNNSTINQQTNKTKTNQYRGGILLAVLASPNLGLFSGSTASKKVNREFYLFVSQPQEYDVHKCKGDREVYGFC